MSRNKPLVGLAGGVGSGKSSVAKILSELGAGVIDSDFLSHQEINDPEVVETLRRWWGPGILSPDGGVDRRKVASIVFADASQRHRLEALLHPRIAVRRQDMIAAFEKHPQTAMIVLDSPLLYETDLDLACDAVIFVEALAEVREARLRGQRNWLEGELRRREKLQQPLDTKRVRADYICENNSDLEDLRQQVKRIFDRIVSDSGGV